jgi:hypothetical protein
VNSAPTIGDLADHIRSKNAGPFWQTIDIFFASDETYGTVAENTALNPAAIGRLYRVAPDTIHIYRLPHIRVVKISFPRRVAQGAHDDRDIHAGQQHIPLSKLTLDAAG